MQFWFSFYCPYYFLVSPFGLIILWSCMSYRSDFPSDAAYHVLQFNKYHTIACMPWVYSQTLLALLSCRYVYFEVRQIESIVCYECNLL